jgi:hypothetical protein
LHGGRVWAESGAGGENRFVVELPTGDHNGRVALHPSDAGAEAGSDSP